jgi:hypothetical protein
MNESTLTASQINQMWLTALDRFEVSTSIAWNRLAVLADLMPCAEDDDYRDLEMIARDGPAKPVAPKATTVAQEATAHPAIAGLTFLGRVDHRLGMGG